MGQLQIGDVYPPRIYLGENNVNKVMCGIEHCWPKIPVELESTVTLSVTAYRGSTIVLAMEHLTDTWNPTNNWEKIIEAKGYRCEQNKLPVNMIFTGWVKLEEDGSLSTKVVYSQWGVDKEQVRYKHLTPAQVEARVSFVIGCQLDGGYPGEIKPGVYTDGDIKIATIGYTISKPFVDNSDVYYGGNNQVTLNKNTPSNGLLEQFEYEDGTHGVYYDFDGNTVSVYISYSAKYSWEGTTAESKGNTYCSFDIDAFDDEGYLLAAFNAYEGVDVDSINVSIGYSEQELGGTMTFTPEKLIEIWQTSTYNRLIFFKDLYPDIFACVTVFEDIIGGVHTGNYTVVFDKQTSTDSTILETIRVVKEESSGKYILRGAKDLFIQVSREIAAQTIYINLYTKDNKLLIGTDRSIDWLVRNSDNMVQYNVFINDYDGYVKYWVDKNNQVVYFAGFRGTYPNIDEGALSFTYVLAEDGQYHFTTPGDPRANFNVDGLDTIWIEDHILAYQKEDHIPGVDTLFKNQVMLTAGEYMLSEDAIVLQETHSQCPENYVIYQRYNADKQVLKLTAVTHVFENQVAEFPIEFSHGHWIFKGLYNRSDRTFQPIIQKNPNGILMYVYAYDVDKRDKGVYPYVINRYSGCGIHFSRTDAFDVWYNHTQSWLSYPFKAMNFMENGIVKHKLKIDDPEFLKDWNIVNISSPGLENWDPYTRTLMFNEHWIADCKEYHYISIDCKHK